MTARVLRTPLTHRAAAALAVLVAALPAASANVGAPSSGGQLAGEPAGVRDVAILREELVIDLRPLAADGRVAVAATYHLDNPNAEQVLDLVFASGSGEPGGFRVTLDGRPVPATPRADVAMPDSWRAPASTPLPGGDGELEYELRDPGAPLGFQLTLTPGRHALSVSYSAAAVRHHHHEPAVLRQFAYVLAPARTWAGFGGLDVTVRLPPGWVAGVSPPLARDRDTLHAVFAAVPADAIALTVRAPTGGFALVRVAALVLFALATLGGGAAVFAGSAARQRRRSAAGTPPSFLAALVTGGAWAAVFLATGLFAVFGPDLALADGQADHRGYGQAFAAVLVVLGSLPVLVIGVWGAHAAARRAHARRTATDG